MADRLSLVQEWGSAVAVPAAGPDARISPDMLQTVESILRHNAKRTAELNSLDFTSEVEIVAGHSSFGPPGSPIPRPIYSEYDEETGEGIGPVIDTRWEWQYGWRAFGVRRG